MTPSEFKAWFEGFTEAMEGRPDASQWEKIKKRVAEIDGTSITEKVFIDRYWPRPWPRWNDHGWYYHNFPAHVSFTANSQQKGCGQTVGFNSMHAMKSLGVSDYQAK